MPLRALVRVLPTLVLMAGSIHAAAILETPGSEAYKLPAPHVRSSSDQEIYPAEAVQLSIEGRVLAAFDITTEGNVTNVTILWAENPLLADATRLALSRYHFDVPSDWARTGVRRRWRMGFVYCLAPSEQSDEFALPVPVTTIKLHRQSSVPVEPHPGSRPSKLCASE
jgi:TonB family protein